MRRILLILTVAAIMAATLAVSGGSAWAFNPQPDPPGSMFAGYEDVAVQDSEYDAVGISDSEREATFFRGGV